MDEKKSLRKEFTKGFLSENPVLRLVLGTCPTLAISTSVTKCNRYGNFGNIGFGLHQTSQFRHCAGLSRQRSEFPHMSLS
jgi:hypothetical protein